MRHLRQENEETGQSLAVPKPRVWGEALSSQRETMKTIKVCYRRAVFSVQADKPQTCQCCGKKGKIDLHHWKYDFKTSEVRKNKQLALKNTSWLCFTCHRYADAIRAVDGMPTKTYVRLAYLRYEI